MFKPGFLTGLLLLVLATGLFAQQTNDTLPEVEVKATKANPSGQVQSAFTAGQAHQEIDPLYRQFYQVDDLGRMLTQQSSVFIKSYGINSMATLSMRGASAAQSGVYWKGIPLMNPALGVADISLLQAGMFDEVTLQYGGSGALWGSGNVGGAILLGNKPFRFYEKKANMSLSLGGGSFHTFNGLLATQFQDTKWYFSGKGFYQYARNDFEYVNTEQEKEKLPHAKLNAIGALFSLARNWSKSDPGSHYIALDVWYQQYNREIPPALFEYVSQKTSIDRSLRSLLEWQIKKKQYQLYAKAALNEEWMRYEDPPAVNNTENRIMQYFQELGFQRTWEVDNNWWHTHSLLLFVPIQYVVLKNIDTGNYDQFRPAIAAAYRYNYKDFQFNAALRQEWWNGKAVPLLPQVGAEWKFWDFAFGSELQTHGAVSINGSIQKSYRIPALNELYIFPSGNNALKPEQGWSQEIGYSIKLFHNRFQQERDKVDPPLIRHELNYFNRDIRDWIIWLGGSIWTPHNLARVWSRGVETRNTLQYPIRSSTWVSFSVNTTYVLATNTASYMPADSSIGRQIPYTPRYVFQGNAGIRWKRLFLNYNHSYTGYRFVTMDESQYLEPYQAGNIQLAYHFQIARYRLHISTQIQNLWNAEYQVVWGRPMPHRYYLWNVQFVL